MATILFSLTKLVLFWVYKKCNILFNKLIPIINKSTKISNKIIKVLKYIINNKSTKITNKI